VLGALQELIEARHAQFNGTLYQLEPDVKDAPGGAARHRRGADDRGGERSVAPAAARRRGALAQAEDFLLRVRTLLHLERRRNDNVLGHELQEKLAGQLGYPGRRRGSRSKSLMADYFSHARVVARTLERVRRTAPVPVA
jgi:[protein-PII] uridylyltransferase